MKEKIRSEILHDALNFLEDEIIEEVDGIRGSLLTDDIVKHASVQERDDVLTSITRKSTSPWRKWTAIAAGICVIIIAGHLIQAGFIKNENSNSDGMPGKEESILDVNQMENGDADMQNGQYTDGIEDDAMEEVEDFTNTEDTETEENEE